MHSANISQIFVLGILYILKDYEDSKALYGLYLAVFTPLDESKKKKKITIVTHLIIIKQKAAL